MAQAPYEFEFEISPMIFPVGKEVTFTIRPLSNKIFNPRYFKKEDLYLEITRKNAGTGHKEFTSWNLTTIPVTPDENSVITFTYKALGEGEHAVRIFSEGKKKVQLAICALEPDLMERTPLRGDFHMHTRFSDGTEDPAVVCANYRALGYDFITVTDHKRYYPSLIAIDTYNGVDTGMEILPGEEVHLPGTSVHIVNAGGLFSVNGLLPTLDNYIETEGALDQRRLDHTVTPPEIIQREDYDVIIDKVSEEITDCPDNVEKRSYAVCKWAFDKIREADGLAVFAHPMWLADMWHVPEPFTQYMFEKHPFDAYEVIGGQPSYEENGLQVAIYYDEWKKGRIHPIVGSTDSHGSTARNPHQNVSSTIVFAKSNTRKDIISAVKDMYSVALDTSASRYRIIGDYRLQKYVNFLMEHFYPIHDRLAKISGDMMYLYAIGKATKEEVEMASKKLKEFFELMIER
jgi:predicted metal-dependent phosphoesterase TrpH